MLSNPAFVVVRQPSSLHLGSEQVIIRRQKGPLTFICLTTVAENLCLGGIRAVIPGTQAKLFALIMTCVFFPPDLPELMILQAASGAS